MKKILLMAVLSLVAVATLNAQQQKLAFKGAFFGYDYLIDGASTDLRSFRTQLGSNPVAPMSSSGSLITL